MAATDFVLGSNVDFSALYQALGMLLERRTSDPVTPVQSQVWVRTDLNQVKWYDGTTTHVLANLDGVVVSVTNADGTLTFGGTSSAITIKVAKALDHTYITDFDTQVRTSRLDQMAAPGADVSWNSHKITNLLDPTGAQDAATKNYVDLTAQGLTPKTAVVATTFAVLQDSPTYANGASGVGATLTANVNNTTLTIDGINISTLGLGTRVIVKTQASGFQNGFYQLSQLSTGGLPWILTRTLDADVSAELVGAFAYVEQGTNYGGTGWVDTNTSAITFGTTAVTFGQLNGPGTMIGSTYINVTGNVISLITPLPLLAGGTGGTTAATARSGIGAPGYSSLTIGDASSTSFTHTHGLNNLAPIIAVERISDGVQINCARRAVDSGGTPDANKVTVNIGTATAPIGTNTHKIIVVG